jgi:hypothetical protein
MPLVIAERNLGREMRRSLSGVGLYRMRISAWWVRLQGHGTWFATHPACGLNMAGMSGPAGSLRALRPHRTGRHMIGSEPITATWKLPRTDTR